MRKTLLIALTTFLLSIGFITDIKALETTGSISIYLEDGGKNTSIEGIEFKLVKVANLVDGKYVLEDEFSDVDIDINNLETADLLSGSASKLSSIVTKNNISGITKKTNGYGMTKFDNLSIGVYLLQAININKYDSISPTLISIPTFSSTSNNVNGMDYDIAVIPKHTPITAVKTGDNSKIVELLFGFSSLLIVRYLQRYCDLGGKKFIGE